MKILKNNFNKIELKKEKQKYPKETICDECQSELEYDKSDMTIGWLGAVYIKCPLCGNDIMLCEEDGITLTVDNVEFPTHFNHTSKETGAKDICNNEEVRRYINEAINYFRMNKNEFAWCSGSGNMMVHVYRFDDDEEYAVYVSNNYYATDIPFENGDYE